MRHPDTEQRRSRPLTRAAPTVWLGHTGRPTDGLPLPLVERLTDLSDRERRTFPPVHTPPELYGLGRAYRVWLGWPRWLPLTVYGDHGVFLTPELPLHERTNGMRVHLTWSEEKAARAAARPEEAAGKRVMLIRHPYLGFRERLGISWRPVERSVLVFLDHSVPGYFDVEVDPAAVRDGIGERLDDGEVPVVSLHRFDVERGVHRALAAVGLRVVTAGRGTSPHFVDRFYAMVTSFSRVITDLVGSHLLYCAELGMPVELLPPGRLTSRRYDVDSSTKGARLAALAEPGEAPTGPGTGRADLAAAFMSGERSQRERALDRFLGRRSPYSDRDVRRTLMSELVTTGPRVVWTNRAGIRARMRRPPADLGPPDA